MSASDSKFPDPNKSFPAKPRWTYYSHLNRRNILHVDIIFLFKIIFFNKVTTRLNPAFLMKHPIYPELFELSNVVFSVPATQVSVERLFSGLKFELSPYRCNITANNLEN